MIENGLIRRIYHALQYREMIEQKGKYYITTGGKKENITQEQLEEIYRLIIRHLDEKAKAFQNGEIQGEEVEKELGQCLALMQPLGDNFIHKTDSKIASKYVKILAEGVKKSGREMEVKKELQEVVIREDDFRISILMDLYHTGLIKSLECYFMLNTLYTKGRATETEIIDCIEENKLPKIMVHEILGKDKLVELYEKKKSIKYINYLPTDKMIELYDTGKLGQQELAKTSFNKGSILGLLEEKGNVESIQGFLNKEIPNRMVPTAEDFLTLLKNRKITEEECEEFLLLEKVKKTPALSEAIIHCHQSGFFNNRKMFTFVKYGWVEDDILIELHEMQQIMKSAVLFPDAFKDEHITDDELREYFNTENMIKRKQQGKLTEEFFEFYQEILPKEEKKRQEFETQMVEEFKEEEGTLENLLLFWKKGILGTDSIRGEIDEEEVIENADNIEHRVLWNLYNHGILSIEGLAMIFEDQLEEIAEACKENKLEESALELMSKDEMIAFYEAGQLSTKNIVKAYYHQLLSIEELKELSIEQEKIQHEIEEEMLVKSWNPEQIRELFLHRLLNYDGLMQMMEQGVISQEEFIKINQEFDFETAIAELRNRQIQSEAVAQGEEKLQRYTMMGESERKKRPNISVETRLAYFQTLEAEDPEHIYRSDKLALGEKAALEGYDYLIAKKLGVILLEKFYEDNTSNREIEAVENATYILPPMKLIEYLEKSNKGDLRNDKHVRYVYHTANWGRNLLKACAEVNPGLNKRQLLKEYRDMNEYIKDEYEKNAKE